MDRLQASEASKMPRLESGRVVFYFRLKVIEIKAKTVARVYLLERKPQVDLAGGVAVPGVPVSIKHRFCLGVVLQTRTHGAQPQVVEHESGSAEPQLFDQSLGKGTKPWLPHSLSSPLQTSFQIEGRELFGSGSEKVLNALLSLLQKSKARRTIFSGEQGPGEEALKAPFRP